MKKIKFYNLFLNNRPFFPSNTFMSWRTNKRTNKQNKPPTPEMEQVVWIRQVRTIRVSHPWRCNERRFG